MTETIGYYWFFFAIGVATGMFIFAAITEFRNAKKGEKE